MEAADGRLEEHEGRWRLRFERRLAHSPERVWRAITEPDDLRAWFPFDIDGERAAGAPLRFVFREGEAEPFEGRMVDFDAPRALELEWGGGERLRLEVRPDGDGSVLTLLNAFDEEGKAARDGAGCTRASTRSPSASPAPPRPRRRRTAGRGCTPPTGSA